jgi:hypothetical protein
VEYPEQYPSYRSYEDGRWVVVQNQTEFDALEAGYAAMPPGPVPDQHTTEPESLAGVVDHPPDSSGVTRYEAEAGSARRARELRDTGMSLEDIARSLRLSMNIVRQLLGES